MKILQNGLINSI